MNIQISPRRGLAFKKKVRWFKIGSDMLSVHSIVCHSYYVFGDTCFRCTKGHPNDEKALKFVFEFFEDEFFKKGMKSTNN